MTLECVASLRINWIVTQNTGTYSLFIFRMLTQTQLIERFFGMAYARLFPCTHLVRFSFSRITAWKKYYSDVDPPDCWQIVALQMLISNSGWFTAAVHPWFLRSAHHEAIRSTWPISKKEPSTALEIQHKISFIGPHEVGKSLHNNWVTVPVLRHSDHPLLLSLLMDVAVVSEHRSPSPFSHNDIAMDWWLGEK